MFILYTAQFKIRRVSYCSSLPANPSARYFQCLMVPGTVDPMRDWEFDL